MGNRTWAPTPGLHSMKPFSPLCPMKKWPLCWSVCAVSTAKQRCKALGPLSGMWRTASSLKYPEKKPPSDIGRGICTFYEDKKGVLKAPAQSERHLVVVVGTLCWFQRASHIGSCFIKRILRFFLPKHVGKVDEHVVHTITKTSRESTIKVVALEMIFVVRTLHKSKSPS